MASCTCASAQSSTPSESPEPADIVVDSAPTAITLESLASHLRSTASLALNAVDDACNLRDVHQAYACLEELLAPVSLEEREAVTATRGELSALLGLVNEAPSRRIEAVEAAVDAAHEAVNEGRAQCVALGGRGEIE